MSSPQDIPPSRRKSSEGAGSHHSASPVGSPPGRARTFSTTSIGTYNRAIVLAVDASDHAKYSFEWYLENIHRSDDLIVLIHCPEPPRLPTLSFKSPMAPPIHEWKEILDEMNSKTRRLEEDYEGTCIQKKLKYKVRGESAKNPGEYIVKVADEENAAMICMGTRGLGTVKRAILGSVSDYVVRNTHTPVIVVPSRKK